jgi:hypothetical protein
MIPIPPSSTATDIPLPPGWKRSRNLEREMGYGLTRESGSKRRSIQTFLNVTQIYREEWLFGLLLLFKLVFACATDGASPVIRKIIKRGPRFYTAVRVSIGRVVHIAANRANIFVHSSSLLI